MVKFIGAPPSNAKDVVTKDYMTGTVAIVNVKDYGAVGDGVTNDRVAVQAALDAGANRMVIFPPGRYLINKGATNTGVYVSANTHIKGIGATLVRGDVTSSILTNYPEGDSTTTAYNGRSNILIEGMTFDGMGDASTAVSGNITTWNHAENITLRNCTWLRPKGYHSCEVNSMKNVLIENCNFLGYVVDLALTYKEAVQVDCAVSGSLGSGAYDNTVCQNITVRNCRFGPDSYGNPAHQVAIGSHAVPSGLFYDNITVENCIMDNTMTAAVRPYYWRKSILKHVVAHNLAADVPYGIRAEFCDDLIISDCQVYYTDSSGGGACISVRQGDECSVLGCYTYGGSLGVAFNTSRSCSAVSCHTKFQKTYGLIADACNDILFSSNLVHGSCYPSGGTGAIRVTALATSIRTSIVSNRVVPHGAGTEASYAVAVGANAVGTWVFGNDFMGMPAATTGAVSTTSNRIS